MPRPVWSYARFFTLPILPYCLFPLTYTLASSFSSSFSLRPFSTISFTFIFLFFLLLASFPFFLFFYFSSCSFFSLFLWIHCVFLVFAARLSLHRGILACFTERTSCSSSLFFPANFFDVRDTVTYSSLLSLSLDCRCSSSPSLSFFATHDSRCLLTRSGPRR